MKKLGHFSWMIVLLVGIFLSFAGARPALALDPGLYIADWGLDAVFFMDSSHNVSQFFPITEQVNGPLQLEADLEGNLIVSMADEGRVYRVSPDGTSEVIAQGLSLPRGLACDAEGNLYVGEAIGNLRRISPSGEMSLLISGLGSLEDLEFDSSGNLYGAVFDGNPSANLLRISRSMLIGAEPIIPEYINAGLAYPIGLDFYDGMLYVADFGHFRIAEVNVETLSASTYYSPLEIMAQMPWGTYLTGPLGIAFTEAGDVYISMYNEIWQLDANKNLTTVADGFSLAEGILYVAEPASPPRRVPPIIYLSNNPSNWIDKNEYIARVDTVTGAVKYLPATYNYYTNKDGWANPDGLTFLGNRLFITGFIPGTGNPNGIWEIDPITGQELYYFRTPTGRLVALTSDGKYLYASHYYGSRYTILKYTTTGQLVSSFKVPVLMNGLAWGRGYLFGSNNNVIYRINPNVASPATTVITASIVDKFIVPWRYVMGLDFVEGPIPYLAASVFLAGQVYAVDLNPDLSFTGITEELTAIPPGYNNAVAIPPFDGGVVPPAPADDGVVPPAPNDAVVPVAPATNVTGK